MVHTLNNVKVVIDPPILINLVYFASCGRPCMVWIWLFVPVEFQFLKIMENEESLSVYIGITEVL